MTGSPKDKNQPHYLGIWSGYNKREGLASPSLWDRSGMGIAQVWLTFPAADHDEWARGLHLFGFDIDEAYFLEKGLHFTR